ncbi:hypothetical protein FACS1894188_01500 [Clostridia bacterium]|nr:hypothetical protein FACS1894188_01500 [Clostridia bacterium]
MYENEIVERVSEVMEIYETLVELDGRLRELSLQVGEDYRRECHGELDTREISAFLELLRNCGGVEALDVYARNDRTQCESSLDIISNVLYNLRGRRFA